MNAHFEHEKLDAYQEAIRLVAWAGEAAEHEADSRRREDYDYDYDYECEKVSPAELPRGL